MIQVVTLSYSYHTRACERFGIAPITYKEWASEWARE